MKRVREKVVSLTILCGILVAMVGLYQCPSMLLFNLPCPGCGMTRAYLALLRLDPIRAFQWHPLFPIPLAVVVYTLFRNRLIRWRKYEPFAVIAILLLFIVTWGIRILL